MWLLLSIYLAAVLETWLAPRWQVLGATPDLLALVAMVWLTAKPRAASAVVMAAMIGLVSDLNSPAPLGLGLGAMSIVAVGVWQLQPRVRMELLPTRLAAVWLAATLVAGLQGAALKMLLPTALSWQQTIERTALTGLYTAGVALPVLMIAAWRTNASPSTTLLVGES